MAGIGKKIEENIQLQEFTERALSMVFDILCEDEDEVDLFCDDMGITESELWWLFEQLGYDRYEGLEQEDEDNDEM